MGWGSWLMALAGPLVWKALASLGMAIFVFVGVEAMTQQLIGHAQTAWAGLPGTVAQLMGLAGINTAFSIVAGGITARVSMLMLKRWGIK